MQSTLRYKKRPRNKDACKGSCYYARYNKYMNETEQLDQKTMVYALEKKNSRKYDIIAGLLRIMLTWDWQTRLSSITR